MIMDLLALIAMFDERRMGFGYGYGYKGGNVRHECVSECRLHQRLRAEKLETFMTGNYRAAENTT